jgi:hypothetical protein
MPNAFQMNIQEHPDWCWAAVGQSIRRYFSGSRMEQCEIANEVLRQTDCCKRPLPSNLDTTAHLEAVLSRLGVLQETKTGVVLSFDDIHAQIVGKRLPICVRIGWHGQNRGHFVVVWGCPVTATGEQWVDIADPFYGYSAMPYDHFVHSYLHAGEWTDTFLVKPAEKG